MKFSYSVIFISLVLFSCKKDNQTYTTTGYRQIKTISYNNIIVGVVIDKPANNDLDAMIIYHGTELYDSNTITAANVILDSFKNILDRKDMLLVSVGYTGENMLLGDNIVQAEAALLWVKNKANEELGINVKKIFLAGHSQGGYLVSRLNTMYQTNGVIANAPGPLNLVYRCQLEESGQIPSSVFCTNLKNVYGTTSSNPDAYIQRSLLNFTTGFKSDIFFVQGLNDSPIHLYSWPSFKQDVLNCTNCQSVQVVEIAGGEHNALFSSPIAKTEFNYFINTR